MSFSHMQLTSKAGVGDRGRQCATRTDWRKEGNINTNKKRILVVDDETSITRLLKMNLEQTGDFVVQTENNASHALTSAQQFQPDLILLDVLMPGLDGGQLAERFHASLRFAKVPIIFLTAAATKHEVNMRHGLIGGQRFLAKPVDMSEVVASIQEHLAG